MSGQLIMAWIINWLNFHRGGCLWRLTMNSWGFALPFYIHILWIRMDATLLRERHRWLHAVIRLQDVVVVWSVWFVLMIPAHHDAKADSSLASTADKLKGYRIRLVRMMAVNLNVEKRIMLNNRSSCGRCCRYCCWYSCPQYMSNVALYGSKWCSKEERRWRQ